MFCDDEKRCFQYHDARDIFSRAVTCADDAGPVGREYFWTRAYSGVRMKVNCSANFPDAEKDKSGFATFAIFFLYLRVWYLPRPDARPGRALNDKDFYGPL